MMISIDFMRLPYFELLPSISFSKRNVLVSWFIWGLFVAWCDVEADG